MNMTNEYETNERHSHRLIFGQPLTFLRQPNDKNKTINFDFNDLIFFSTS